MIVGGPQASGFSPAVSTKRHYLQRCGDRVIIIIIIRVHGCLSVFLSPIRRLIIMAARVPFRDHFKVKLCEGWKIGEWQITLSRRKGGCVFPNSIEGTMREEFLSSSRLVCFIIDILIELAKVGASSIDGSTRKEFLRSRLKAP